MEKDMGNIALSSEAAVHLVGQEGNGLAMRSAQSEHASLEPGDVVQSIDARIERLQRWSAVLDWKKRVRQARVLRRHQYRRGR